MHADDITQEARRIHFSSIVIDTHVDTPQRILFSQFDVGRGNVEGSVDIPRMREGGVKAIFFALWVPVGIIGPDATKRALDLLEGVREQVSRHPRDLTLATCSQEVHTAQAEGKIAVLMGVEGGHAIDNSIEILRDFFQRGVRYMTLTHNASTDWADSSNQPPRNNGLTHFGRQVVTEMNRLGMLVDVSHVSDQTFYDVLEVSRAPVIASHSCCRAICGAPRNMTDDMIKALAKNGGVIHITFHNAFLSQEYSDATRSHGVDWIPRLEAINAKYGENEASKLIDGQHLNDELMEAGKLPKVSWQKIVDHIDHAARLVGADHVGVGSDFDGAFMPMGMEGAAQLPKITEELLRRGHSEDDIRNILGRNVLRLMDESKRVARLLQAGKY